MIKQTEKKKPAPLVAMITIGYTGDGARIIEYVLDDCKEVCTGTADITRAYKPGSYEFGLFLEQDRRFMETVGGYAELGE